MQSLLRSDGTSDSPVIHIFLICYIAQSFLFVSLFYLFHLLYCSIFFICFIAPFFFICYIIPSFLFVSLFHLFFCFVALSVSIILIAVVMISIMM